MINAIRPIFTPLVLDALVFKELITRRITCDHINKSIGTCLNRLIPRKVQYGFFQVATFATAAINRVTDLFFDRSPAPFKKIVLAPILEEVAYRFVIQKSLESLFALIGLGSIPSKVLGIGASSIMFGFAHNGDPETERFAITFTSGCFYGALADRQHLGASILIHFINNLIAHFRVPNVTRTIVYKSSANTSS